MEGQGILPELDESAQCIISECFIPMIILTICFCTFIIYISFVFSKHDSFCLTECLSCCVE